jgi:RNA polymerase sigma-70 factor (ECF subfamily)
MATHETKADSGLDVAACLARVRRGDDVAARELVTRLYPLVLKIVRAHRPRRVAEEDLAQDIFLKMFSHLDQYRGEVPVEHWLARIAVTTCLDQLRAQKRRPELRWADLSEDEAEVLEAVTAAENEPHPATALNAREIVQKLLECLSPQDRMVVTLLDLEERSLAEIRKMTGWNETLIKVRAFRARRKLRKHLADLERGKLR